MIKRMIFSKVCNCGNAMGLTLTKFSDEDREKNGDAVDTDLEVTAIEKTLSPSCYMVGDSTVQCSVCGKRYRSYHRAYVVEARTWKES